MKTPAYLYDLSYPYNSSTIKVMKRSLSCHDK